MAVGATSFADSRIFLHSLTPTSPIPTNLSQSTHQAFQEASWAGNDNHQLFHQLHYKSHF